MFYFLIPALMSYKTILIAAAVLVLNLLTNVSPIIPVVASAIAGILLKAREGRAGK